MKQLLFLSVMIGIFLGSSSLFAQGITGNGRVGQEARKVNAFSGISAGGIFDIFVKQGDRYDVVIEADENLFDAIETRVSDNTLKLKTNKNIRKATKMNVYITVKELTHLNISGSADFTGQSHFTTNTMDITCSGAASMTIDLEANRLKCNTSGSSDLEIKGFASQVEVQTSGASDFEGGELKAKVGVLSASGSSDLTIHLSDVAGGSASGSSDITIKGSPATTNFNTSGSADIHVEKGARKSIEE